MSGKWRGQRGSRHERGYDNAWLRLRLQILARDCYICQPCAAKGRTTEAKQVDHILPKSEGGTNDPTNLQSICIPCHTDKTQREAAEAQGRSYKRKRIIGRDGWPIG